MVLKINKRTDRKLELVCLVFLHAALGRPARVTAGAETVSSAPGRLRPAVLPRECPHLAAPGRAPRRRTVSSGDTCRAEESFAGTGPLQILSSSWSLLLLGDPVCDVPLCSREQRVLSKASGWQHSRALAIFQRRMLFKVVKFAVETCKALDVNSLEPVKVALTSRYAKSRAILGFPPELAVGAGGGGARLLLVGGTLRALRAVTPRGSAPGRPPLHRAAGTSLPPHSSWECRPGNSEDRVSWLGGPWGSLCHLESLPLPVPAGKLSSVARDGTHLSRPRGPPSVRLCAVGLGAAQQGSGLRSARVWGGWSAVGPRMLGLPRPSGLAQC